MSNLMSPSDVWNGDAKKKSNHRPVFAKIDPNYTSGRPRVIIEGESTLTSPKIYTKGYTPAAGDKVILLRDVIIAGWSDT